MKTAKVDVKAKAYAISAENGGIIRVSEIFARTGVIVSVEHESPAQPFNTILLTREQWLALCDLKYDIAVNDIPEESNGN